MRTLTLDAVVLGVNLVESVGANQDGERSEVDAAAGLARVHQLPKGSHRCPEHQTQLTRWLYSGLGEKLLASHEPSSRTHALIQLYPIILNLGI